MEKKVGGFPGGSDSEQSACSAEDLGSIPGLGRPLEEGMATHSSILAWRIPMGSGVWWATVHGVAESDTTERLSTSTVYNNTESLCCTCETFIF